MQWVASRPTKTVKPALRVCTLLVSVPVHPCMGRIDLAGMPFQSLLSSERVLVIMLLVVIWVEQRFRLASAVIGNPAQLIRLLNRDRFVRPVGMLWLMVELLQRPVQHNHQQDSLSVQLKRHEHTLMHSSQMMTVAITQKSAMPSNQR
jgi:hypothetical protein